MPDKRECETTNNIPADLAEEYERKAREAAAREHHEEAIAAIENAIVLYKENRNIRKYVKSANFLGVLYAIVGNESAAVDHYLEALECAEDHGILDAVPGIYNNIGSRYQELGKHQKALYYFNKAEAALAKWPEGVEQDRFFMTRLIISMNIGFSSIALKHYKRGKAYLDMAEKQMKEGNNNSYHFPLLYLNSQLELYSGRPEFAKEHLEEMMECARTERDGSDYVQNRVEFHKLLRDMKEYDSWEQSIRYFEEYAEEQNTTFFRLTAVEMRMEYCQCIGDMEQYKELCVEHMRLYQIQQEIELQERSYAIDIKIALREQEEQRKKAELLNESLKHKSEMDALTQVGNRYALEVYSMEVVREFSKSGNILAVGVIDIDCFKQVNDTYGHTRGDECLVAVADIIKEAVKDCGRVFRFGGDEFILLITEGDCEGAERAAEEISRRLAECAIENINSTVVPVLTVSQGYACFVPDRCAKTTDLLEYADKALYRVKNSTRNDYRILMMEDLAEL